MWDLTWQPQGFGRCEWTHCISPPSFNNMGNNWDGNPLAFGDSLTYSCNYGFFFEDNQDRITWEVSCLNTGQFDIDPDMRCVTSKFDSGQNIAHGY